MPKASKLLGTACMFLIKRSSKINRCILPIFFVHFFVLSEGRKYVKKSKGVK